MNRTFKVTGMMKVKGRTIRDNGNEIIGFVQKDGSIVRLVVALEVEHKGKLSYLSTDKAMNAKGFDVIKYYTNTFYE